jgi:beta-glucanase (GH16 family)
MDPAADMAGRRLTRTQFFNNSQEIDLEFLSKEFTESGGAVNLVLQTPESVVHGYDASNTSEFRVHALPFRPDEQFHEYRFDWSPEKVTFYVDGQWIYEMSENIPTEGGHIFLNHWSNGDPLWSAGPPDKDTPMTVSYVKAYFNSTDDARTKVHQGRCPTFDPSKVCPIPAQTKAPNGNDALTYFFSQDGERKTPGQIIYDTENGASTLFGSSTSIFTFVPVVLALVIGTFSL